MRILLTLILRKRELVGLSVLLAPPRCGKLVKAKHANSKLRSGLAMATMKLDSLSPLLTPLRMSVANWLVIRLSR